ncbi:hypothetical protein OWV82_020259 [Melia azedarach]|uniref:Uncharacterized protein n=1 Tax=Melia azedarach TaxID=155640 RepID=A0ACC1X5Q3_MELAZ|nr:hypothetical protein OWV82_020259 [Melia azedarach]
MFEQNCPSSQVAVSPYAKNSVNFRIFNVTLIPNSYSPKLQTDDEHRFPVVNGVGDESESTEKSTVVEEFSDPRRKNVTMPDMLCSKGWQCKLSSDLAYTLE